MSGRGRQWLRGPGRNLVYKFTAVVFSLTYFEAIVLSVTAMDKGLPSRAGFCG